MFKHEKYADALGEMRASALIAINTAGHVAITTNQLRRWQSTLSMTYDAYRELADKPQRPASDDVAAEAPQGLLILDRLLANASSCCYEPHSTMRVTVAELQRIHDDWKGQPVRPASEQPPMAGAFGEAGYGAAVEGPAPDEQPAYDPRLEQRIEALVARQSQEIDGLRSLTKRFNGLVADFNGDAATTADLKKKVEELSAKLEFMGSRIGETESFLEDQAVAGINFAKSKVGQFKKRH